MAIRIEAILNQVRKNPKYTEAADGLRKKLLEHVEREEFPLYINPEKSDTGQEGKITLHTLITESGSEKAALHPSILLAKAYNLSVGAKLDESVSIASLNIARLHWPNRSYYMTTCHAETFDFFAGVDESLKHYFSKPIAAVSRFEQYKTVGHLREAHPANLLRIIGLGKVGARFLKAALARPLDMKPDRQIDGTGS